MTKEERAAKWDAEFIPCKNHPERRCKRAHYVRNRSKKCSTCCTRRLDGSKKLSYKKSQKKQRSKWLKTEIGKAYKARQNSSEAHHRASAWYYERKLHG